jgi:cobalt-zinc-cadmium efflux system membrane fusion protein
MSRPGFLLITGLTLLLGCHDHEGHDHEHPKAGEGAGHAAHEDHEGEPPHADHGEEEGVVHLTAEAIERSGIRVGTARAGMLGRQLTLPAEVQLNPDQVAHISPLVDGQLLSVEAALGDRVVADQPLAQMRSVALGQARAELNRTTAIRRATRATLERQRSLRKEGISSERRYLEARLASEQADAEHQAARSRLRVFGVKGGKGPDMTLTSPIAGRIVERHATRGETIAPSDTLFVVADLARVWVIGRAYEQQIADIQLGMPATLTLNAYPGRTWTGTVDFIGARIEEDTRTLPIRVEIQNDDRSLRPGLFGSLGLARPTEGGDAVLVPSAAVVTIGERKVVFMPGDEAGEYAAVPVTIAAEAGGQAAIAKGLTAGQTLVVDGAFVLKSELMRAELGHGHAH